MADSAAAAAHSMVSLADSQDVSRPEDSQEPEYQMEDPGEAWISLVEATRVLDLTERKGAIEQVLFLAKNSHWNRELWDNICTEEDAMWLRYVHNSKHGGDYTPQEMSDEARTKVTARHPFKCGNCGARFTNEYDLVEHVSHCF